jgi:predicted nucleic-acid-binding protein
MKIKIINFLNKHNINYSLGQVAGKYEAIKMPYKQRAEFLEYLIKNRIKVRDINYSDDMTEAEIIFEKESKI